MSYGKYLEDKQTWPLKDEFIGIFLMRLVGLLSDDQLLENSFRMFRLGQETENYSLAHYK